VKTPRGAGKPSVLLLTGPPGVGKTTVIREVARALAGRRLGGFYTEELRLGRSRRGFTAVTFDGWRQDLARVDCRSPARVGRYGVDLAVLEELAERALGLEPAAEAYLVDEIGKMECLSARFVAAMRRLLDAGRPVVATVGERGGGFIAEVKARPGVPLWRVTHGSREALPAQVLAWLSERPRAAPDRA
jgi:nucleoside-triphosphatase